MIEFGAGGAIMHTEEPATTTEPQPAETAGQPAVDDIVSSTAATRSVEGDQPALVAVPEIVVANADSSTAGPPEMAAQPATNDDPAAASVPPPSQASPAPPVPPSPVNPLIAVPPQNPRRKRRAKGWSCPVCRQRKRPRTSISHSSRAFFFFFAPLADITLPHFIRFFSVQLTHPCCGLRPLHL
jgi:hypothetical protein